MTVSGSLGVRTLANGEALYAVLEGHLTAIGCIGPEPAAEGSDEH